MQLSYCAPLNSQFLQVQDTARYDMVNGFFMAVAYSVQWTAAAIHNPCIIKLGRDLVGLLLLLGLIIIIINTDSLHLMSLTRKTQRLFLQANIIIILSFHFIW